jgi:methylated-DNA-protein-cysteine methyltransferase-like protein
MTEFSLKVIAIVKTIPRGKVATYGQIARLAGKAHGARGVGWILNSSSESHDLPWQRVINSQGKISFGRRSSAYTEQRQLLLDEGVQFFEHGSLDLTVYQWKKEPTKARRRVNTPSLFS